LGGGGGGRGWGREEGKWEENGEEWSGCALCESVGEIRSLRAIEGGGGVVVIVI